MNTMKDIPNAERPYEKCLKQGAEALSDAELLAVLLRTGMYLHWPKGFSIKMEEQDFWAFISFHFKV